MSRHSIRLSALAVAAALLSPLWSSGSSRADGRPSIVTDPDAVVLGRTLTEWTALYLRWANATPASSLPPGCGPGTTVGPCYNAFYDPTGAYAEVVAQGSHGQASFGPPGLPVGIELFPSGIAGYWVIIEGLTPGKHAIGASYSFTNKYFGCPSTAPCTSTHTEQICVSNNPPCIQ